MKLHWSPRSPYVRKVMIVIRELGLYERIEYVRSVAIMTSPNPDIMADNPLNKIPTLVTDEGRALYDSRVICEYLTDLSGGRMFFKRDSGYFDTLRRQALGDGLLDLSILWRNEQLRPKEIQSQKHIDAFTFKANAVASKLEEEADDIARAAFDIGHVSIGCALSYLDFRFPELKWRENKPRLTTWHESFETRPCVAANPIIDD